MACMHEPARATSKMVKSRALLIQTMVQRGSESFDGNHVSWISVPIDIAWNDCAG